MKKNSFILLFFIAITNLAIAQKNNFTLDTKSSSIQWEAKKVIGGHVGTIGIKDGKIAVDKNKITGGEFTIDMQSLQCTDAPKATDHLKNEDFFNVTKFTTAKFVITKVDNSKAQPVVTGNLTIKEKTKSISFPIKVTAISAQGIEAEASNIKINRLDYDIRFRSKSLFTDLGDKAIEDEFTLNIKIKATK